MMLREVSLENKCVYLLYTFCAMSAYVYMDVCCVRKERGGKMKKDYYKKKDKSCENSPQKKSLIR